MHRASISPTTALFGAIILLATAARAAGEGPAECNAYFPLSEGRSWTYREGPRGGKPRLERLVRITTSSGSPQKRTAVLEQSVRSPGDPGRASGMARTSAECTGGRILMRVTGTSRGRDGNETASGSIEATLPGLPPAHLLEPGYTWSSQSRIVTRDGDRTFTTEGNIRSRVAGHESISVPAGNFERALKIEAIESLVDRADRRSAEQRRIEWYAEGVGLVLRETRVRSGGQEAVSVETLISYGKSANEVR